MLRLNPCLLPPNATRTVVDLPPSPNQACHPVRLSLAPHPLPHPHRLRLRPRPGLGVGAVLPRSAPQILLETATLRLTPTTQTATSRHGKQSLLPPPPPLQPLPPPLQPCSAATLDPYVLVLCVHLTPYLPPHLCGGRHTLMLHRHASRGALSAPRGQNCPSPLQSLPSREAASCYLQFFHLHPPCRKPISHACMPVLQRWPALQPELRQHSYINHPPAAMLALSCSYPASAATLRPQAARLRNNRHTPHACL